MNLPVVIGVDPALGGGCAVVGCALGDKIHVLDCKVVYSLSKFEQIFEIIGQMARTIRPHMVIVEINALQKGIAYDDRLDAMGTLLGFTVKPHLTQYNKNMDAALGVASMDASFKRGDIRIPWGDDETRRRMEPLVTQLKKWRGDVKPKNLRQDAVMALWFCYVHWQSILRAQAPREDHLEVPSWLTQSPTQFIRRAS